MNDAAPEARAGIVAARIDSLREILERHGAAAVTLRTRRDFAWLTVGGLNHVVVGSETGIAPIVVSRDHAVVLAPTNEFARIVDEEIAGLPLRCVSVPWWDDAAFDRETQALANGQTVLTAADLGDELQALRSVLVPLEHQRMTALAADVDAAMRAALGELAAGNTEDALAGKVGARLAERGARLPVILVAADDRIGRYRHPIPTGTPIRGRVMVVVVAERWGLHVAATQFRELAPRSAAVAERAAAISDVLARMREATAPGNSFGDVFAAARTAYEEHGMPDEWTLHHQGGSIGYAPRERIAKPGDASPIRPGMAFAWNPSAVGYKAEETLYLDPDGGQRVLTTTVGQAG